MPEPTGGTVDRTRGRHLDDAATAARYPSGHAAWPLASLVVLAPHPESCDQQQHPERHGVNPYQPDEGEYAHPGEHREEQTKDHREYAAEDQSPLACHLLAQSYGRGYLRDPGDYGPSSHQVEKRDRGEPGVDEGDNA